MSQNIRIKDLVVSLSNERELEEEVIYQVIEEALSTVTERQASEPSTYRVEIDRKTDEYETYRSWAVVADDTDWTTAVDEEDELLLPSKCMLLSEAQELDPAAEVDMILEKPVDSISFGRIAAQQARQVIMQKVREAERERIAGEFRGKVGEMMAGTVKRVTREFILLDMGNHVEAILDRHDALPRESFHMGDRVRAVLHSVREEKRGPQLRMSRVDPEFLIELFKVEVPEIGEEVVEIRCSSRDPGVRAKIAVKTGDNRVDPVGACVGMRGARVQAVSNELKGERVDIILWDADPVQLVINSMAPAEIASIVVDEEKHSMDLSVSEEELAQAIGRGGQNVRLASQLTGWELNVMTEEEAKHKHNVEAKAQMAGLIEQLDIDEDLAELLVNEGFSSIETIAYVELDELTAIDGFDAEVAEELQSRAKEFISAKETAEQAALDAAKPADDLLEVEGIDLTLAKRLAVKGVVTRDDLAELAVDELQEIIAMDAEQASKIIMAARAHWFDEE